MQKKWTIDGLYKAMQKDLEHCRTEFERSMCRTICGMEIKERAYEVAKARPLTRNEYAIASQFGYC